MTPLSKEDLESFKKKQYQCSHISAKDFIVSVDFHELKQVISMAEAALKYREALEKIANKGPFHVLESNPIREYSTHEGDCWCDAKELARQSLKGESK